MRATIESQLQEKRVGAAKRNADINLLAVERTWL